MAKIDDLPAQPVLGHRDGGGEVQFHNDCKNRKILLLCQFFHLYFTKDFHVFFL